MSIFFKKRQKNYVPMCFYRTSGTALSTAFSFEGFKVFVQTLRCGEVLFEREKGSPI